MLNNPKQKTEKVYRVFFHELGHFVARQINFIRAKGPGTKEIQIYPCEQKKEEYCGHINFNISEGFDIKTPPPLERLPEHLASLSYGCFFQGYYCKTELKECFGKDGEGEEDTKCWASGLSFHSLFYLNNEISNIDRKYFCDLRKENLLADFMSLDPQKYLGCFVNNNYNVDVQRLQSDTKTMIKDHIQTYDSLIKNYREKIEQAPLNP